MANIPSNEDSPTVLIVDDEDDILDLLSYNLQRDGFATLTARDGLQALVRGVRRHEQGPDLLRIHDLEIDRDRYLVFKQEGAERVGVRLPRKEFELLCYLARHPGKVFGRQELLDRVWSTDVYVVDRTVDVHVRKIREKLGSHLIETVKGVGYRFAE